MEIAPYLIHLAIIIVIFVILAVSLNLALGYTGLMNLGHIAFYGIGAYSSAILTKTHGQSFWLGLFVGAVLAALLGYLLTIITNKLKGDYFALGTLGFAFVMYAIFLNWTELTRGPLGIPGIPKPSIFGWTVSSNEAYLLFSTIIAALIILCIWLITRSRYGRLIEAVRDDAIGLQALGKPVFRLKTQAMMLSAAFAAIAGSLYAHYISFIDPSTFYLHDLIVVFTIVIVGGLASTKGNVLAGIVILLIPELLRFVDLPPAMIGPMRQMLYGLILILMLLYRPRGFFGRVDLQ